MSTVLPALFGKTGTAWCEDYAVVTLQGGADSPHAHPYLTLPLPELESDASMPQDAPLIQRRQFIQQKICKILLIFISRNQGNTHGNDSKGGMKK